MAKYEFVIELPVYLPPQAVEELKMRLRDRMKELSAKCAEYQVDLVLRMKTAQKTEKDEERGEP